MAIKKSELPGEVGEVHKTREVAEMFGVLPATIVEWIKCGKIGGFKTPSGQYRVKHSDVIQLTQEIYGEQL